MEHYNFYEYYVVVNDGWNDTQQDWELYPVTFPMELYYKNYSYININDLDGVTFICAN